MLRKLIFGVLILGLLAGAGAYMMLWASAGPKPGPHTIVVADGSSLARVANQLVAAGAVPGSATSYRAMAKLFASGDPVQAGEFEIPKGATGAAVLDLLQHGQPVQRLLTVTEGMPSIIVQERLAAASRSWTMIDGIPSVTVSSRWTGWPCWSRSSTAAPLAPLGISNSPAWIGSPEPNSLAITR